MRRLIVTLGILACAGCAGVGGERHSLSRSSQGEQAASCEQTAPSCEQVASVDPSSQHSRLYNRLSRLWAKPTPDKLVGAPPIEVKTARASPRPRLSVEPAGDLAKRTTADPAATRTKAGGQEKELQASASIDR